MTLSPYKRFKRFFRRERNNNVTPQPSTKQTETSPQPSTSTDPVSTQKLIQTPKTPIHPKGKYHIWRKKDFKFFNARNCSMYVKLIKITDGDTFTVAFPVKIENLTDYYSTHGKYNFEAVDLENDKYTILYFTIRNKGFDAYEKPTLPGQLGTLFAYHTLCSSYFLKINVPDDLPDKYGRVLANVYLEHVNKTWGEVITKGCSNLESISKSIFNELKTYDKRLNGAKFSSYSSWNNKPLAVPYDGGTKTIQKVEKSSKSDKGVYNALILAIEKKQVYDIETTILTNRKNVCGIQI